MKRIVTKSTPCAACGSKQASYDFCTVELIEYCYDCGLPQRVDPDNYKSTLQGNDESLVETIVELKKVNEALLCQLKNAKIHREAVSAVGWEAYAAIQNLDTGNKILNSLGFVLDKPGIVNNPFIETCAGMELIVDTVEQQLSKFSDVAEGKTLSVIERATLGRIVEELRFNLDKLSSLQINCLGETEATAHEEQKDG